MIVITTYYYLKDAHRLVCMSVPKAKTLIERFGFNDPELTTPEHDEMFIVCMNSAQNIIDLAVESDDRFSTWRRMMHDLTNGKLVDNLAHPYIPFATNEYLYLPDSVVPEKPVATINNFIVGFIDVFVCAKLGSDPIDGEASPFNHHIVRIGDGSAYRVKLDDVYDNNLETIDNMLATFNIMIEIKPFIRSAGELIRQMQMYRQYDKGDTVFVVISKTTGFKDILAQADIMLINYNDVLPPTKAHHMV